MTRARLNGGSIGLNNSTSLSSAYGVFALAEQSSYVLAGRWPSVPGQFNINNSLRFRSSASAYLNRTPASAGNRTTWTWSGWFKKTQNNPSQQPMLFSASAGASTSQLFFQISGFGTADAFGIYDGNISMNLLTTAVYRDPSAWYHIVVTIDTTQATSTNRAKLYINGVQVTSFGTATYPAQNAQTGINNTVAHGLGTQYSNGALGGNYCDGYMAEVNFIDGQALTPSSFGTYDVNGVWQPINYSGTYGTNGFHLTFGNTTSTTTLGYDTSGNSNNWTTNNISLTAGSTYDSMTDSPMVTSATVANYATFNPIFYFAQQGTLTAGNLSGATPGTLGSYNSAGTMAMQSKTYFEMTAFNTALVPAAQAGSVGIMDKSAVIPAGGYAGTATNTWGFTVSGTSAFWIKKSSGGALSNLSFSGFANGDILQIAYDPIAGNMWVGKNGTWNGTGNPSAGTNPDITGIASLNNLPLATTFNDGTNVVNYYANFGQRAFTYTPPTGFVGLNTYNLPAPTIANGAQYMGIITRAGTQSNSITVTGLSFQPDLIWTKNRGAAFDNIISDTVSGIGNGLVTNTTAAQTFTNHIVSVNPTGYVMGQWDNTNNGAYNYVDWAWKANGTGVSNTSGSITSTVSANTTAGFSIVTYTGTGANATVGHGLGVAPSMVIVKLRSSAQDWIVWQTALAGTEYLIFTTAAKATGAIFWNSTTPTSTVFSIGSSGATNTTSGTYVAYCWAAVSGYSAFGSYTGNGSADGPFVYANMRPRYVLIKRTDSTGDWYIWDTSRNTYNVVGEELLADTAGAGNTATDLDILSNGFKIRTTTAAINASSGTYIYAAFAENPFNTARAR